MALTVIDLMLYPTPDGRKWLPFGLVIPALRLFRDGKVTGAQAAQFLDDDMAIHAKGADPPTLTDDDKAYLATLAAVDLDHLQDCLVLHERNPNVMTKAKMSEILEL